MIKVLAKWSLKKAGMQITRIPIGATTIEVVSPIRNHQETRMLSQIRQNPGK
jgi:hypothetical protein